MRDAHHSSLRGQAPFIFVALVSLLFPFFIRTVDALCSSSSPANSKCTVVWFRNHAIRTQDNDALRLAMEYHQKNVEQSDASSSNHTLKFVFLWDKPVEPIGGTASDVFLVHALDSLNQTLNGRLKILNCPSISGDGCGVDISKLSQSLYAFASAEGHSNAELFYLETYDNKLETELERYLSEHPLLVRSISGSQTLTGNHGLDPAVAIRQAITGHDFNSPLIPFVNYVSSLLEEEPIPKIKPIDLEQIPSVEATNPHKVKHQEFVSIRDLLKKVGTTRQTNWGAPIARRWPATEQAAANALDSFVRNQYPSLVGTAQMNPSSGGTQAQSKRRTHLASHLSPYLSLGLLSPKQVYHSLDTAPLKNNDKQNSFLRRLAWRDYAYAVSTVFPEAIAHKQPIRLGYEDESSNNESINADDKANNALEMWKSGSTGFPLVDAGMRQLIKEGFMPQQVRLAASACLVEGLTVSWKLGMKHFEEYLVDFDIVINTQMWLNAAGVGLDPYYLGLDYKKRPYWDSDGAYVRKWCPELSKLDRVQVAPFTPGTGGTNTVDALYTPWKAPPQVLEKAGIKLGERYPYPICDEREGRRHFLQRLRQCRSSWPASKIDESGNDLIEIDGRMVGTFTPRCIKV